MLGRLGFSEMLIILIPLLYLVIVAVVLYFIIKFAIKKSIKELKEEKIL